MTIHYCRVVLPLLCPTERATWIRVIVILLIYSFKIAILSEIPSASFTQFFSVGLIRNPTFLILFHSLYRRKCNCFGCATFFVFLSHLWKIQYGCFWFFESLFQNWPIASLRLESLGQVLCFYFVFDLYEVLQSFHGGGVWVGCFGPLLPRWLSLLGARRSYLSIWKLCSYSWQPHSSWLQISPVSIA